MQKLRTLLLFLILIISSCFAAEFTSNSITIGSITIKSSPQHQEFAHNLLLTLNKNIDKFQRKIGVYPEFALDIVLAENSDEYSAFTKHRTGIIEFSNAMYNQKQNTIYLRSPAELGSYAKINKVLLHEYIHAFVGHYFKKVPLWFNEGMAVYFSDDLGYDRELNFIWNRLAGNTLPLNKMVSGYPKNQVEWESFYAKSGLAVKYLATKQKPNFYRFWEIAEQRKNFPTAFRMSFFQTYQAFSNSFQNYAKRHFHYGILFASSSLLWGIMPFVFLIGVLRKKIKTRRIAKRWKSEEVVEVEDEAINGLDNQT